MREEKKYSGEKQKEIITTSIDSGNKVVFKINSEKDRAITTSTAYTTTSNTTTSNTTTSSNNTTNTTIATTAVATTTVATKISDKSIHDVDIREQFINVNTDASLEGDKEKGNISLLSLLRKRLIEGKTFSRFLITFKICSDISQQKHISNVLNELFKEQFKLLKGICLFINVYSVMFIETENTEIAIKLLKVMATLQYLKDIQILYFSEMNKQIINDSIYFYEYTKDDIKKRVTSHDHCYVDEIWELYICMLELSVNIRNNKSKNITFEKNEKVKLYLSLIQILYEENAKEFLWTLQDFFTFFVERPQLSLEEFTDDFIDF